MLYLGRLCLNKRIALGRRTTDLFPAEACSYLLEPSRLPASVGEVWQPRRRPDLDPRVVVVGDEELDVVRGPRLEEEERRQRAAVARGENGVEVAPTLTLLYEAGSRLRC